MNAFVVGATGAVGLELVKLLAESSKFSRITLLARRNVESAVGEKFVQKSVNFENLEENSGDIRGNDVAFCALGTTKAKSGTDGFYKVDHDYVVNTAKIAKENGVRQFILISSNGADPTSRFLYMKTKGQVEKEIGAMNFEKFVILRPGLIEASREETRIGETIGKILVKPLKFFSNKFSSSALEIGKAMIQASQIETSGTLLWDNAKIVEEAKNYTV